VLFLKTNSPIKTATKDKRTMKTTEICHNFSLEVNYTHDIYTHGQYLCRVYSVLCTECLHVFVVLFGSYSICQGGGLNATFGCLTEVSLLRTGHRTLVFLLTRTHTELCVGFTVICYMFPLKTGPLHGEMEERFLITGEQNLCCIILLCIVVYCIL
jgi:hypothetical protein